MDPETDGSCDQLDISTTIQHPAQKGFTWRRALIVPIMIGYFGPLGLLIYSVPQYTQVVAKEKYNVTNSSISSNPCSEKNSSESNTEAYDDVQQETAKWSIYFSVANSAPAIIMNLIWGSYSDILGRRFQFVLCTLGAFIRVLTFTLIVKFKLSLVYYVIACIVDGFSGGFTAMFAVMFAFAADITNTGKQRMAVIISLEILVGLLIAGISFASGYLIGDAAYFLPSLISCAFSVCAILVAAFFMPETIPTDSKKKTKKGRSILKILTSSVNLFFRNDTRTKNVKYSLLLAAFTLYTIPGLTRGSLEVLYQIGKPFCWLPTEVGIFGAIKIGAASIVSLVAVYLLQKCFADDSIAIFTATLCVASFVFEALARTDVELYAVIAMSAFSLLPIPMLRSLMSSMTSPEQQGALFATIGIVETLANMLGTLTNNMVYSATLSIMNGFPFLISAGITFLSLIALVAFHIVQRCSHEVDLVTYETLIQEEP